MRDALGVGRVLRASTGTFVVGCRVSQLDLPAFGSLVWAAAEKDYQVFGLVYDTRIQDDGLVRQLVTAESVSAEVILDNRERRVVPVEISALVVGFQVAGRIRHQLPPRPPLSLDVIHSCDMDDLRRFTSAGRFDYFRHILRAPDIPVAELVAAHLRQARAAQEDPQQWTDRAVRELITLLRDDFPLLTSVLGAIDIVVADESSE